MIKSIVGFINGNVTITNQTHKTVYLSDGTQWNKNKFHENRTLIKAFMLREVAVDPDIQEVMDHVSFLKRERKEALHLQLQALGKEVGLLQALIHAPVQEEKPKINPQYHYRPALASARFVCGWTVHGDVEEQQHSFRMIFWNGSGKMANGHSNLVHAYEEATGEKLFGVRGGFYFTGAHNNGTGNTVYLFGRSDSYGHFQDHIPYIRKYAEEHGFKVLIGKTSFTNDSTPTDVITEHFRDYDPSVEQVSGEVDNLPF